MDISIIIPSYKPQPYAIECFDSIANQTFDRQRFEIIIILNGSESSYYEIMQSYINKCLPKHNVTFLNTDIAGVSNARNMGLDVAVGEYICFIDDDDYISPQYIEELYNVAKKGFIPLSYTLAVDDNTQIVHKYYISELYEHNIGRAPIGILSVRSFLSSLCFKLLPKSAIGSVRFNLSITLGEDSIFMFYISKHLKKFQLTSKNAIYYRRYRDNSTITNQSSKNVLYYMNQYKQYTSIYTKDIFRYNFLFYVSRMMAISIDLAYKYNRKLRTKK